MNKDNASKWIELGSAMLQGKTIQRMNRGEWVNVTDLNTISYDPESYRIKPEPSQESLEMASYLEEMAKSIRGMKIQPHDITNIVSASGCGTIYNVTFIYSVRT